MLREADLLSYLPTFMQEYKEIAAALSAENPEFNVILKEADNALDNEFITTADETGIKRFEALLGILPGEYDTLESRRTRVLLLWFISLPYTLRMLIKRLTVLCGGTDFTVEKDFDAYYIRVITHFRLYSQVLQLRKLLKEMIPANMVSDDHNIVIVPVDGIPAICTGIARTSGRKRIRIEFQRRIKSNSDIYVTVKNMGVQKKIKTEVRNYGME